MTNLYLTLLGPPQITLQGKPLQPPLPVKGQALLFYLASVGQPVSRQRLAGLLWSDQPEEEARRNLRVTLNALQNALPGFLEASRMEIGLRSESFLTDVLEFWYSLREAELQAQQYAVELYQGDFLSGFSLRGAPLFEEWMAIERERLRQEVLRSLLPLAKQALTGNDPQRGIPFAQLIVKIDPRDEDAHYLLMQLYQANGQRSAALQQYESCRLMLAQEWGVEPSLQIRRLLEQVRQSPPEEEGSPLIEPPHNLPVMLMPFVGRISELSQLEKLLHRPECRLLTLVGLGGIGKTRLALAAARRLLAQGGPPKLFPQGLFFVSLAGAFTTETLWIAVAQAIGLEQQPRPSVMDQCIHWLRGRKALLVLDNFEQIEACCSGELVALLAEAPQVKLLVTSRAALQLYEEWVVELRGFATDDSAENDAENLFLQVAQRVKLDFDPLSERPFIRKICRLVDGHPLGIELAASWTRVLSCREIAELVERNQASLSTPLKNLPERHTSLSAVFETSWMLLERQEQQALASLGVFPADFDLSAAESIAGGTARIISRLMNASLVYRDTRYRYHLHTFIRESAVAQIEYFEPLRACHCQYYAQGMKTRTAGIKLAEAGALEWVEIEMANLRQMWQVALEQRESSVLTDCAAGLARFWELRGRLEEGERLLTLASQAYADDADRLTWAVLTRHNGRMIYLQGRLEEAQRLVQASLAALEAEQPTATITAEIAEAKNHLGVVLCDLGLVDEALQLFMESYSLFQEIGDVLGQATTLLSEAGLYRRQANQKKKISLVQQALQMLRSLKAPGALATPLTNLGDSLTELGEYELARSCFEEALVYAQQLGMNLLIANLEHNLGTLFIHMKEYARARERLLAAIEKTRQNGSLDSEARIHNDMGALYDRLGDVPSALAAFEKALEINRLAKNTFSIVINLNNIGLLQRKNGQLEQSRRNHLQALKLALDLEATALALDAITGVGAILGMQGKLATAWGCFAFVAAHAQADRQTLETLEEALRELGLRKDDIAKQTPLARGLPEMQNLLAK